MGDDLRVGIVGPVPPPAGGMAGQTAQLVELLAHDGVRVTFVPTNAPYRPAFVGKLRGVRAAFRLIPYIARLWRCVANVDVLHVMANSGWSWHLFAAPAGRSYLIQAKRLAAYLQAGLLLPTEEEALTVRATRDALAKLDANPERLLQA